MSEVRINIRSEVRIEKTVAGKVRHKPFFCKAQGGSLFKIYVDVLGSVSTSQLFTLEEFYFCVSNTQLPDPKRKLSLSDISCTFLALFSNKTRDVSCLFVFVIAFERNGRVS